MAEMMIIYTDMSTYLIDSTRVGYSIGVFDHGYWFTCQDGLIDPEGGREDLGQTDVSRDFVADRYFYDVTRYDLFGPDPLNTGLVASYDLTHLGFVLLERLNRGLGVSFLPDADHGIGDKDEQNDEGLDEGRERILVLFK